MSKPLLPTLVYSAWLWPLSRWRPEAVYLILTGIRTVLWLLQCSLIPCAFRILESTLLPPPSCEWNDSNDNARQWSHVPTEDNPADHASRGLSANDLMTSKWFHGPTFLRLPLPQPDTMFFEIPEDDVEVKIWKATTSTEVIVRLFEQIAQRFSSKSSLIRTLAVLVRKCNDMKGHQSSPLEVLETTEKRFIVCLQREHFEHPTLSLRNHCCMYHLWL